MPTETILDQLTARLDPDTNQVVLSSADPLLAGWSQVLDPYTQYEKRIRDILNPEDVHSLEEAVLQFEASKAQTTAYKDGLMISKLPLLQETMIPLLEVVEPELYIGLDMIDHEVVSLYGNEEEKLHFVSTFFRRADATVFDFAQADLSNLPANAKRDYGTSVALSFMRNPNLQYLVLNNYAKQSQHKRSDHPAVYSNMLEQILDHIKMFKSVNKRLILAEGIKGVPSDLDITFNGNGSFIIDDVVIPLYVK